MGTANTISRTIEMVDLKSQYKKIKNEVDNAIINVIEKATFINGPQVKEFQAELEKYLHVKHVIPCANGTDALQIAMMALGLKPGDEVITANFTYVATAEVIALLGLTPVLVDVDPSTFNIDVNEIKKVIGPKTKAIVPVHLYGQCADMESIITIASEHNLFVIEDCAQAIGASYTFSNGTKHKSGTMGTIGCTSFFPSKNLGCYGDGGAMYTNDDEIASRLRMISNHGQSVRYYHDCVGVNSRLDSIQAAVLSIKLKHLDSYASARNSAAGFYDSALDGHPNIIIPKRAKNSSHVFHQYTIRVINSDRDKLKEFLESKKIPVMIYYPVPLHLQKAFRSDRYKNNAFPITAQLCKEVLSLPMHTELDTETLKYICDSILDFFKQ